MPKSEDLCFHCAFRFSKPNDSHICNTPWSVFQDGSKISPTYSCQRWEPFQYETRYTSPLNYPSGPKPAYEGCQQAGNFTPRLGPVPTVRHVKGGRNAASDKADERAESLLIKNAQAAEPQT